jgi:hypothetical protein
MKFNTPSTILAATAALAISGLAAQAQESKEERIAACTALGSSEAACATSATLNDAATPLFNGVGTRESFTAYMQAMRSQSLAFATDTTAQFAYNEDMSPEEATISGALWQQASNACNLPEISSYEGQGLSPEFIIGDFIGKVYACMDALETVTNPGTIESQFGETITISDEFRAKVEPLDAERSAIIQLFGAVPDCHFNETERSCATVRAAQP